MKACKLQLLFLLMFTAEIIVAQHSGYKHQSTVTAVGAKEITVTDITKSISKGKQNGLKTDIWQANKKEVEKAWAKAIRQDTKSKVESNNNEISINATYLTDISKDSINVYSILNEYQDHVELNFFVEQNGQFIDKRNEETEYLGARKFLRDFAVQMYKEAVEEELKAEQKKLEDKEDEVDKLIKENEKLFKQINEEERDIEKAKNDIKTNEMDQDRARGLVQQQKDELVKLQGSPEEVRKDAEKVLKGYENDLSKLVKQNDNLHKSIDKSEANIREKERNIEDNKGEITRKKADAQAQKDVVYAVEKKLENIK